MSEGAKVLSFYATCYQPEKMDDYILLIDWLDLLIREERQVPHKLIVILHRLAWQRDGLPHFYAMLEHMK